MPRARTTKSSKRKAADAGRVRQTRLRRSQRLSAKSKNLQTQLLPNLTAAIPSEPIFADDIDLPVIHLALGRWPENKVPNIHWDLSEPGTWTYKRPFTEEEMEHTAFFPEQKRMLVALSLQHSWIIALEPRAGYRFMTLRCFQEALSTCMRQPVSRAIWDSADIWRKYDIAMAYFRRTGCIPAIPNLHALDVFAGWRKWLTYHINIQQCSELVVRQMTEYVTHGVTKGSTRLQTIDLLGRNFMFAGLTFLKEPDLWELNTTSRHVANMAHHLLPRPKAE